MNTIPTDLPSAELNLLAGLDSRGEPIFEKVFAAVEKTDEQFRLLHSPMFVRGVAKGDLIEPLKNRRGEFKVLERSGVLAIRVLAKSGLDRIEQNLTPEMEKLGGAKDIQQTRALVYSIHFAVGFQTLETLFDRFVDGQSSIWQYGNVYDPQTGEALHWWDDLIKIS